MPEAVHSMFVKWVSRFTAIKRLFFCLALTCLSFIILLLKGVPVVTSIMIGWDLFCLLMISLCGLTIFTSNAEETCKLASREDESHRMIFAIVLVTVFISLFAILILVKNVNEQQVTKRLHEWVSLLGVGLSWFLLHAVFTLHYTHLYYGDNQTPGDPTIGGLEFPQEKTPDYLDFAYFSFVIGMTFQVSDISITAKKIRRLALLHGIISFLFNTIILSLTISVVQQLFNK